MKKITALIPARGGSKGVPRKNIKDLCGKPLIAYTIDACLQSELIERVVVSTEDSEIAEVSIQHGAEVPYVRPLTLASDSSTDRDVIKHFLDLYPQDCVAYMRPTTPIREAKKIDEFINFYFENESRMSGMRSMHELPEPPHKMFQIVEGYCKGFFRDFEGEKDYTNLPRQTFPKAYQPNGYIDICKRETMERGTAFGLHIMPVITENVVEVDTLHEFKLLEYQLMRRDT